MIKGDKRRMPLSMEYELYFKNRKHKTGCIKRDKAARRHLLAESVKKANPSKSEK